MQHIRYPDGELVRVETIGEKIADAIVHGFGLVAGLIGLTVLFVIIIQRGDLGMGAALAVYAVGVLALFSFSLAYNMMPPSPVKWLLRRFDHSSIYLMIAGTYTPLLVQMQDKIWALALGIAVWVGSLGGIVLKIGFPNRFHRLAMAAYVALGWSIVVALGPLFRSLPFSSFVLVIVGGLIYTSGIGFYLSKNLKYNRAIWHGFVVAAAACQFASIAISLG